MIACGTNDPTIFENFEKVVSLIRLVMFELLLLTSFNRGDSEQLCEQSTLSFKLFTLVTGIVIGNSA